MCGISGIVSLTGRPIEDASARVTMMNRLLRHRGPDSEGVYVSEDGLVALGNTRLAIVDVANHFPVPLVAADGAAVLSYNGEIYNYLEERVGLEARGRQFRTNSDTEVLLQGLQEHGAAFLSRLDGFWGFAYYEPRTRRFMLGRDLMGERHVFYREEAGELIFSSEMPPLLAATRSPLTLDFDAIACAFQFRAAPPGRTLVKGVLRLGAGAALTVEAGTPNTAVTRAVRLEPERWMEFFAGNPSEDQVLDAYQATLEQACRRRVPREVAFLTTLSGGLDSALVNAFVADRGATEVHSLFGLSTERPPRRDGDTLDELAASRFTSERLNTRHHVFNMLGDECVMSYREQASNSFDGLLCEGVVAFEQLAQEVAAHNARVLVLSDGPDELIGGYDVDIAAFRLQQRYGRRPVERSLARLALQGPWKSFFLPPGTRRDLTNWRRMSQRPFYFRPAHGGTTETVMQTLFGATTAEGAKRHFGTIPDDYSDVADDMDISQRMALSYAAYSLPDYYNLRSDRGTMRHSVESRLPMQAPNLVNLMIATPAAWRFKGGAWSKYVFRRLVERRIGPEVAYRQKYGFAQPAWAVPRIAEALDMESTVGDSRMFEDLSFEKGAREFLLRPEEGRHRWMAYCVALVHERLRTQSYMSPPGGIPGNAHAPGPQHKLAAN